LRDDISTSCPAATQWRASTPPMLPVPMMPMRIGSPLCASAGAGAPKSPTALARAASAASAARPAATPTGNVCEASNILLIVHSPNVRAAFRCFSAASAVAGRSIVLDAVLSTQSSDGLCLFLPQDDRPRGTQVVEHRPDGQRSGDEQQAHSDRINLQPEKRLAIQHETD